MTRQPTLSVAVFAILFILQAWVVSAQFQFFEQMFGGHPGQQHHQQQQRQSGSASYYNAQADNGAPLRRPATIAHLLTIYLLSTVPCSEYLCPETLVCARNPAECPCPDVQDIKCTIPDRLEKGAASVLCVRGQNECLEVEKLLNAYAK